MPPSSAPTARPIPTSAPFFPDQGPQIPNPGPNPTGDSGPQFQNGKPPAPDAGKRRIHAMLEDKYGVKKADPQKAAKLVEEAERFSENKKIEKAYETYLKAFQLDPKNDQILVKLAGLVFQLGDPISCYEFISAYVDLHPDDVKIRRDRLKVGGIIIKLVQQNFEKLKPQEKAMAQQAFLIALTEAPFDQGLVLAADTKNQLEGLKKREEELKAFHQKSKKEKDEVITGIRSEIMEMGKMTRLTYPDPKQTKMVKEELTKAMTEAWGVLHRFVRDDSDPEVKKLAPLYEAYQLLGQNKTDEAVPPLEMVRSEGYKSLGKGDEAKGKERLLKILDDRKKLFEEAKELEKGEEAELKKKQEELNKLKAEVPEGLIDAVNILSVVEKVHLRRANLAALEVWSQRIEDNWHAEVEDATGFWSTIGGAWFGQPWRGITGKKSFFDEVNDRSAAERDLYHEVRKRIEKGEVDTIQAALQAIVDKGPDSMKARAAQVLATSERELSKEIRQRIDKGEVKTKEEALQAIVDKGDDARKTQAEGVLEHLGKDPLASLVAYVSQIKSEKEAEDALVASAVKDKEAGIRLYATSGVNAIVQFHSRDTAVQKKASEALDKDKLDIDIRKLLIDKPGEKKDEDTAPIQVKHAKTD